MLIPVFNKSTCAIASAICDRSNPCAKSSSPKVWTAARAADILGRLRIIGCSYVKSLCKLSVDILNAKARGRFKVKNGTVMDEVFLQFANRPDISRDCVFMAHPHGTRMKQNAQGAFMVLFMAGGQVSEYVSSEKDTAKRSSSM